MLPIFLLAAPSCAGGDNADALVDQAQGQFDTKRQNRGGPLFVEFVLRNWARSPDKCVANFQPPEGVLAFSSNDLACMHIQRDIDIGETSPTQPQAALPRVDATLVRDDLELDDLDVWQIVLITIAVLVGIAVCAAVGYGVRRCYRSAHRQAVPEQQLIYIPDSVESQTAPPYEPLALPTAPAFPQAPVLVQ